MQALNLPLDSGSGANAPSRNDRGGLDMTTKDFGVREGEVTVELPARSDAGLYYIGRIRTPWHDRKDCPKNARESDAVCTVELDRAGRRACKDVRNLHSSGAALLDGQGAARSGAAEARAITACSAAPSRLRSPARPNPIAMSVVRLAAHRGQQAFGHRARLPRRHAAPRHQALFRLHRQRAGGRRGLAQAQTLRRRKRQHSSIPVPAALQLI